MAHDTPSALATAAPAPDTVPAVLDAERLDVFHASVEFEGLVSSLGLRASRSMRDQLERASASVALNICEGVARRSERDKAQFFSIARGSAAECAAIVHLLRARGLVAAVGARRARALLVRVISMSTRLQERFLRRP